MNPDIELNAAVAHEVMRWMSLGAHLWRDAEGTVYYTGHDPTRVFVPHTVFDPSRDPQQIRMVEAQIDHLDKRQAYLDALVREVNVEDHTLTWAYERGYPSPAHASVVWQAMQQATPAQRCRAALQAVRDVGHGSGAQPKV